MTILSCPLAPLPEEVKTCIHWVFCRKFNRIQFLFEIFFNKIYDFQRKITIPFLTHPNLFLKYTVTEIFTTFIINVYILINILMRLLQAGLSANIHNFSRTYKCVRVSQQELISFVCMGDACYFKCTTLHCLHTHTHTHTHVLEEAQQRREYHQRMHGLLRVYYGAAIHMLHVVVHRAHNLVSKIPMI